MQKLQLMITENCCNNQTKAEFLIKELRFCLQLICAFDININEIATLAFAMTISKGNQNE